MPRPPNSETLVQREKDQERNTNMKASAIDLYLRFMQTAHGAPRQPMSVEDMLKEADKVRVWLA